MSSELVGLSSHYPFLVYAKRQARKSSEYQLLKQGYGSSKIFKFAYASSSV